MLSGCDTDLLWLSVFWFLIIRPVSPSSRVEACGKNGGILLGDTLDSCVLLVGWSSIMEATKAYPWLTYTPARD